MKLHVFNPEHDIALAHDDQYFTAPKVARMLREGCGFLPALWAGEDDCVLVGDVVAAEEKLRMACVEVKDVSFITQSDLCYLSKDTVVEPWGWDSALCFQLAKHGLPGECLPDDGYLRDVRMLSCRTFSSKVLSILRKEIDSNSTFTIGESYYITDIEELVYYIHDLERCVLKEPWSCSGRGVRYVACEPVVNSAVRFEPLAMPLLNWAQNIIKQQGGIMLEPYYNNVKDFGMEFLCNAAGVEYQGLSVFSTESGFYHGNIVASEDFKLQMLSQWITAERLLMVKKAIKDILSEEMGNRYCGPFGVDMMIVKSDDGSIRLHPMVETNVRRTMGHVALSLFGKLPFDAAVLSLSRNDCIVSRCDSLL